MDSRRLLAKPVLARALCTPARTPQNIASTAITAINAPTRATYPISPTAMPLSMMDAVKYGIKISRMTQSVVYIGERNTSFLYCRISFAIRAPVMCFFPPVCFSLAI